MIHSVVTDFSEDEQPGLVEDVPAHGRGVGTKWALRSLPTQTILWFCEWGSVLQKLGLYYGWNLAF